MSYNVYDRAQTLDKKKLIKLNIVKSFQPEISIKIQTKPIKIEVVYWNFHLLNLFKKNWFIFLCFF